MHIVVILNNGHLIKRLLLLSKHILYLLFNEVAQLTVGFLIKA